VKEQEQFQCPDGLEVTLDESQRSVIRHSTAPDLIGLSLSGKESHRATTFFSSNCRIKIII
jgi:hypothetical protein